MKMIRVKNLMCAGLCLLAMSSFGQVKIDSYGNMGIGTTVPKDKLDVRGAVRAQTRFVFEGNAGSSGNYWNAAYLDNSGSNAAACLYPHVDGQLAIGKRSRRVMVEAWYINTNYLWNYSDERIKTNIKDIDGALVKLNKLNGVTYDIKESFIPDSVIFRGHKNGQKRDDRKDNIGVLAQELEKVFPELVRIQDSTGIYSVNYIGLIPVLIEAIKEQQTQITELTIQVSNCCTSSNGNSKPKLKSGTVATNENMIAGAASLGQNMPNPFSEASTISISVPESVATATLYIYNLSGEPVKTISVSGRGDTEVEILAHELNAGIYIYSLLADGQLIGTRQMVITE